MRTAKDHRKLIWDELQQGRLRQGWGWLEGQDLRLILAKRQAGKALTAEEKAAWRNHRMLDSAWGGLREGDVVIIPNLPEYGQWTIARVSGPYRFEFPDGHADFAHILPVEPVHGPGPDRKIGVVHPHDALVDARLRRTMKNMSRMWGIDHLGDAVELLIAAIESGRDLSTGLTRAGRREAFFEDVRNDITDTAWKRLETTHHGAELEHLLIPLLESVYGKGAVHHHGGPKEHGADLIVTTRGPLGLKFRTAIQVKMYDGTHHDTHALDQLRRAREEHGVQAGVVLTTAVEVSAEFQEALVRLGEELQIDIQAWTRDDVMRLLLAHLGQQGRAG